MACILLNGGMSTYQPSFFDESERLTALSQLRDPLEELGRYIDFELFRPELTAVFARSTQPVAGRKPYDGSADVWFAELDRLP